MLSLQKVIIYVPFFKSLKYTGIQVILVKLLFWLYFYPINCNLYFCNTSIQVALNVNHYYSVLRTSHTHKLTNLLFYFHQLRNKKTI